MKKPKVNEDRTKKTLHDGKDVQQHESQPTLLSDNSYNYNNYNNWSGAR